MFRRGSIIIPTRSATRSVLSAGPSRLSSSCLALSGAYRYQGTGTGMVTPPTTETMDAPTDQADVPRCPGVGAVPGMSCPMEDGTPAKMTMQQIFSQTGKSRLSGFVSSTAVVGYIMCGGTNPLVMGGIAIGCYLQGCSANCANQIIEVEHDRKMKRTCKRPLVVGAISKQNAALMSATSLGIGTTMLYACHPMAAALGVANWGAYVGVYTPLKRVSTTNTWWGAIVGGIPPLMGGVAATSTALTAPAMYPAWLLGGVMFVWQIPHFMSLAFHCRRDYEGAGFKMLAFNHPTRASVYAVSLSVVMAGMTTVGPAMCGIPVEPWFYPPSIAANAVMTYKAWQFHVDPVKNCRSCFVFSYLWLAVILALFTVNHFQPVTLALSLWNGEEKRENEVALA